MRHAFANIVLIASVLAGQQQSTFAERWSHDVAAARLALERKDDRAYRDALLQLHRDFPGSSHALSDLATAELKIRNDDAALRWLRDYVQTGQIAKPEQVTQLREKNKLDGLSELLKKNAAPVATGERVLRLPESQLLVEDIAYDPESKTFFLSSIHQNKIIRCTATGQCRDFVLRDTEFPWAVTALRVDVSHHILWVSLVGMNAQKGFKAGDDGRSALWKIDLRRARVVSRYEIKDGQPHAFGDMTLSRAGDLYISDDTSGAVLTLCHNGDHLETLLPPGTFVSPQTPALSADEHYLMVPDYATGLAEVDLSTKHIRWLQAHQPAAFDGIDGLYWVGRRLLAVQNGTRPKRIASFELESDGNVGNWKVLEANWTGLGEPTHGVVVDGSFYFIVNSGWDRVQADGRIQPGEPAEIRRFKLN